MTSSASSSPLSSLSSAPSDNEMVPPLALNTLLGYSLDGASSDVEDETKSLKREASPPRKEVLADNSDIAFIVMFRSRFHQAFPAKLVNFGPQDIESGIVDTLPSDQIERLLCALLGLVLNRKKPVENGHYGRALEEAIQTSKSQWPRAWNGKNPLNGGNSFRSMNPTERLTLIKALIMWSLHESEVINAIIKESYSRTRVSDDINVPISVQPWGTDDLKRRYWLIEGRDDTQFRLYRECNPKLKKNEWYSMAGTIDELMEMGHKLSKESTQAAKRLALRITASKPRFEASEEKWKRREYARSRKNAWSRPQLGYAGTYEGRTRGKRMRYTYDEDEEADDGDSEDLGVRRSTRNFAADAAAEPDRTTVTSSGRHVKARAGGIYGESLLSGQTTDTRQSPASSALDEPIRASRSGRAGVRHSDTDAETSSGEEWNGGNNDDHDELDDIMDDDENGFEQSATSESDADMEPKSLVVTLRYGQGNSPSAHNQPSPTIQPSTNAAPTSLQRGNAVGKPSLAPSIATHQNGFSNGVPFQTGMNGDAQHTTNISPPHTKTGDAAHPQSHSLMSGGSNSTNRDDAATLKQSHLSFPPVTQLSSLPAAPQ